MATVERHIGLLGGTFDPIHNVHLRLAEDAREQLGLNRVLFIPAPNPWRKAGRAITPVAHRVAMVERAIAGNDAFALSTLEIDRPGPTYTADTLASLHQQLGAGTVLHFILGADALEDLPHWHEPERIVALARLAVAARPGVRLPAADQLEARLPGVTTVLERVEMQPLQISSTDLRLLAASGRSLRYLLPDAVAAYVEEHGLYRVNTPAGNADDEATFRRTPA
jgi:nicotinate-nucleotide adenylyltransferase